GPRASPAIAVDIAANAISCGCLFRAGYIELHDAHPVAQRFSIDVSNSDLAPAAGVGDVKLLVIRREADSIRSAVLAAEFVGDLLDLKRFAVHPIHSRRLFRLALVAFIVSANAVGRIGEPDPAIGMYRYIVW